MSYNLNSLTSFIIDKGINLEEEIEETISVLGVETPLPCFEEVYYIDPTFVEEDFDNLVPVEEPTLVEDFDNNRILKVWRFDNKEIWFTSSDGKAEEGYFLFI